MKIRYGAPILVFSLVASACLHVDARPVPAVERVDAASGTQADYEFETGRFMRSTAYRHPARVSHGMAPDGAYSKVNIAYDTAHTGPWYIEEQREGWHTIAAGIAGHDTDAIDRGLTILNWGWGRQQPDGGFDCGKLGRSFHSTSFFVEACAHALLLLQASPYASQYRPQIDAMKPKLLKAAEWLVANRAAGDKYNRPYTHRRYLVADALGETGVLCGDDSLVQQSRRYVLDGLALQDPTGYNPEKGGFDVSYNAGGLLFAEQYYTIVSNADLRPRLYSMLAKSIAWQAGKVRPDGSVDTAGSSRVSSAKAETGPNGTRKKLAVGEVYESFAYWAQISGDRSYADLAAKVAHGPRGEE